MRFNPKTFNTHLDNLGESFLWRRSSACPCITPSTGSPKPNCPHCFGKGRIWSEPLKAKAGVASQKTQLEWAKMGQWESGDMVLAIPENSAIYDIAMYDRLTALTSTEAFSVPLIRGAANERVPGQVEKVTRVFWYNNAGDIVEGQAPTFNDRGQPTWSAGAPPAGTTYTINGERYQEFYCFGPFSNNRNKHDGMRLPIRMVMRAFDLFGR